VTVGDGISSCTATVAAHQCTITFPTAGGRTITASYPGDGNFNAANSAGVGQNVTSAAATVSLARTVGGNPASVNSTLTFTTTVSGNVGTPTGAVTFLVDSVAVCPGVPLNASGQAACSIQTLAAGVHQIVGQYSGNGTYSGGSSSPLSQTMSKTTPAVFIISTSPNPSAVNAGVVVSYSVTPSPSGPFTPGGNVTVGDGTTSCTGTAAGGQCTIAFTTSGSRIVTANYAGDSNFNAAISGGYTQNVSGGGATVTMSANPSTITIGGSSTISATVSGSSGTPTGTVSVSGAGGSCVITLSGGSGSCSLTPVNAGASQTITGTYSGNATYGASSGTTTLTVNGSGGTNVLNVTKTGSGSGTVTSSTAGINCGSDCTESYSGATTVTLTASPSGSSVFTGWLGGHCTGRGQCVVAVSGVTNVSATFGPNSVNPPTLDIDGNSSYDALTDGLLGLRYMFGLNGAALTDSIVGPGASRSNSTQITAYLDNIKPILDIDGNGVVDALTDGILYVRFLFRLTGTALTDGVIGSGATRTNATQIIQYLQTITSP
jgi:hypothetical protein